jgi:glycosyltransferase involved in cell wall biosynthesis
MAMVGRIEPFAKGQDLMIEVLSMEKWRQRNLSVSIYGKGPWEETAKKIVHNRKLTNVRFGGFSKPEEIWSKHHMLALPSRHEGMSLAMLEAMWLGRPVIATAVAGAMSEVVSGHNGFLCEAPTVALWDMAMEDAWNQRQLWREMGVNASIRIRQRMGANPVLDLSKLLISHPR